MFYNNTKTLESCTSQSRKHLSLDFSFRMAFIFYLATCILSFLWYSFIIVMDINIWHEEKKI